MLRGKDTQGKVRLMVPKAKELPARERLGTVLSLAPSEELVWPTP